jgi:hypothetical protein
MKILFSKNDYDYEGDIINHDIRIHFDDRITLNINDIDELQSIITQLQTIHKEITENYV